MHDNVLLFISDTVTCSQLNKHYLLFILWRKSIMHDNVLLFISDTVKCSQLNKHYLLFILKDSFNLCDAWISSCGRSGKGNHPKVHLLIS